IGSETIGIHKGLPIGESLRMMIREMKMPKPYSRDLRERVVRAVEAGASRHEAAAAFEVSASSVWRFFDRHNITFKKKPARRRTGSRGRSQGTHKVETRAAAA